MGVACLVYLVDDFLLWGFWCGIEREAYLDAGYPTSRNMRPQRPRIKSQKMAVDRDMRDWLFECSVYMAH